MKILYQRTYIRRILQENPIILITNSEKSLFLKNTKFKYKKFNNVVLHELNFNVFNGIVYLLFNFTDLVEVSKLKLNIPGIVLNSFNSTYIISFKKFLKLMIYQNTILPLNSIFYILNGNILWLSAKTYSNIIFI
jgi:hypothetical protein